MRFICQLLTLLAALGLGVQTANAAGTTPLALAQQQDANGQPLAGCLLYFYTAGTVATPQNEYTDFGLTTPGPNPLQCDVTGRVPMHWLADGLVHLRLTDASGVVKLDTTMQVLGPSAGGGGGGGAVDPTAIAQTGDIKFRISGETQSGWVILNATTIGSAASGATQRANADTQNLFIYLWNNCTNAHCPVLGGRGASAIADFTGNKQMTLPDLRSNALVGRDCMGTVPCAGLLAASNVTSGGGDGVDTSMAGGGNANTTLTAANVPTITSSVTIEAGKGSHTHAGAGSGYWVNVGGQASGMTTPGNSNGGIIASTAAATLPAMSGSATSNNTSSTLFSNMPPFVLGTWWCKL